MGALRLFSVIKTTLAFAGMVPPIATAINEPPPVIVALAAVIYAEFKH